MGLFHKYNEVERGLLEMYAQMFAGMGMPDPKKMASDMLDRAIEKSKEQRTYDLPPKLGDVILGKASPEDTKSEKMVGYIQKYLPAKRKDGVSDEDILWCWNLYDIERSMMLAVDELHRMALFTTVLQETGDSKEAGKHVWKFHPLYTVGDPKNEKLFVEGHTEKDLPLPLELKDRVNIYIEKRGQNSDDFKKDIEASSSFNALVRGEISAGKL